MLEFLANPPVSDDFRDLVPFARGRSSLHSTKRCIVFENLWIGVLVGEINQSHREPTRAITG